MIKKWMWGLKRPTFILVYIFIGLLAVLAGELAMVGAVLLMRILVETLGAYAALLFALYVLAASVVFVKAWFISGDIERGKKRAEEAVRNAEDIKRKIREREEMEEKRL